MVKLEIILELLRTLIVSTTDGTVKISKYTLFDIQSYLHNAQEKIESLQLESQLQQAELQQWSHHSEPVSVQKIERDSHKQQVINVVVDSHSVPSSKANLYVDAEAHASPPKPIIRPWEELVHNKHKTGLGYDKELSFHILDYSKPIKF